MSKFQLIYKACIRSQYLSVLILIVWAIPLSFALSLALSLHEVAHKAVPLRGLATADSFKAHHFLSLQCTCSKKLIQHLLERKAIGDVSEVIHLIHATNDTVDAATNDVVAKLRAAGFEVRAVDEEGAVREFNLQALPQLVVMQAAQTLYQGGYGPDQQHFAKYNDESIIKKAKQGSLADKNEFPIFGCANGRMRSAAVDPLGVKYVTGK